MTPGNTTPLHTTTMVRRPRSLHGVPPRYQVFDRRKSPPKSVARLYRDPARGDLVVVEVYDDPFREFLKTDPAFQGRRFWWVRDVASDAPHDTRLTVIRPDPMPEPELRGNDGDPPVSLDDAVAACKAPAHYRVVQASDPV